MSVALAKFESQRTRITPTPLGMKSQKQVAFGNTYGFIACNSCLAFPLDVNPAAHLYCPGAEESKNSPANERYSYNADVSQIV